MHEFDDAPSPRSGDDEPIPLHPSTLRRSRFNSTQWKLLHAGLRLYAEGRIGQVALRRIALEADQRNKDAIKYHFGDEDGFIQALIEWQMTDVNDACRDLLVMDEEIRLTDPLRHSLRAIATPFVDLLSKPGPKLQFVHVAADICSSWGVEELVRHDVEWTASLREAETRVAIETGGSRGADARERMNFVWSTIVALTSQTAIDLAGISGRRRRERVKSLRRGLVDWLAGGLTGQVAPRSRSSEWRATRPSTARRALSSENE
jgi:AcrR family transcriptional regulator